MTAISDIRMSTASRQSRATDSQFRAVGAGELARAECHGRAAVVIEPVSAESLRKTGIFPDEAGDFRRFPTHVRRIWSSETNPNARKAGISGLFSRLLGSRPKRRTGWLGREGSNLRMAELKSAAAARSFKENSELSRSVLLLRTRNNSGRSEHPGLGLSGRTEAA